jgi:hypothetical protein
MGTVKVMGITPQIVNDFLDAVGASIQAIRDSNFTEAKRHAEHAKLCGQLLAIHPEFRRKLTARCPGLDSAIAVDAAVQVLLSLACLEGDAPREPFVLTPTRHNGQHSVA